MGVHNHMRLDHEASLSNCQRQALPPQPCQQHALHVGLQPWYRHALRRNHASLHRTKRHHCAKMFRATSEAQCRMQLYVEQYDTWLWGVKCFTCLYVSVSVLVSASLSLSF